MTKSTLIAACLMFAIAGGLYWANTRTSSEGAYRNRQLGFSIQIPEGTTIVPVEGGDDGSTMLLAQGKPQFQIYAVPLEEDIAITADMLKQEIPDLVVTNPRTVAISGDDANALVFESHDESFGPTHEMWFAHDRRLYQIKSAASVSMAVQDIIATWKFD